MNSITKDRIKKTSFSILAIFIIFLIWSIISITKSNDIIYPSLIQIMKKVVAIFSANQNLSILFSSFLRLLITLVLSFIISSFIVLMYLFYKPTVNFFTPFITIMKAVPLVSISLFLWLFAKSDTAPIIITMFVITPIMTEGLIIAVDTISTEIKEEIKLDSKLNFQIISKIYLPLIIPHIVMTLLQTIGLGIKVIVMSEYLCQTENSIGQELMFIKMNLEIDSLMAWTILLIILVVIIETIIKYLSKRISQIY